MSRCRCVAQGAILPGGDLDLDKLCIGLPEPRLLARALRQIGDKVTGLPPRWRRQEPGQQSCHQAVSCESPYAVFRYKISVACQSSQNCLSSRSTAMIVLSIPLAAFLIWRQ